MSKKDTHKEDFEEAWEEYVNLPLETQIIGIVALSMWHKQLHPDADASHISKKAQEILKFAQNKTLDRAIEVVETHLITEDEVIDEIVKALKQIKIDE